MRCATCRYWDRSESARRSERNPEAMTVSQCTRPAMFWNVSEWVYEECDYYRRILPGYEDLMMFVQDGSDYRAALFMRPDFFCAHYESVGGLEIQSPV